MDLDFFFNEEIKGCDVGKGGETGVDLGRAGGVVGLNMIKKCLAFFWQESCYGAQAGFKPTSLQSFKCLDDGCAPLFTPGFLYSKW